MGVVHRIPGVPARPVPSVAAAVAGYLATLDHPETADPRRTGCGAWGSRHVGGGRPSLRPRLSEPRRTF